MLVNESGSEVYYLNNTDLYVLNASNLELLELIQLSNFNGYNFSVVRHAEISNNTLMSFIGRKIGGEPQGFLIDLKGKKVLFDNDSVPHNGEFCSISPDGLNFLAGRDIYGVNASGELMYLKEMTNMYSWQYQMSGFFSANGQYIGYVREIAGDVSTYEVLDLNKNTICTTIEFPDALNFEFNSQSDKFHLWDFSYDNGLNIYDLKGNSHLSLDVYFNHRGEEYRIYKNKLFATTGYVLDISN